MRLLKRRICYSLKIKNHHYFSNRQYMYTVCWLAYLILKCNFFMQTNILYQWMSDYFSTHAKNDAIWEFKVKVLDTFNINSAVRNLQLPVCQKIATFCPCPTFLTLYAVVRICCKLSICFTFVVQLPVQKNLQQIEVMEFAFNSLNLYACVITSMNVL